MLLRGSRETRSHVRLYVCGGWGVIPDSMLRGSRETRSHVRLYVCGQWKRGTAVCGTRGRLVDTLPSSTVRPRALC